MVPYVGWQRGPPGTFCLLQARQAPLPGCPGWPNSNAEGTFIPPWPRASTESSRHLPGSHLSARPLVPRDPQACTCAGTRCSHVHTHVCAHTCGPGAHTARAPCLRKAGPSADLPPGTPEGGEKGRGGPSVTGSTGLSWAPGDLAQSWEGTQHQRPSTLRWGREGLRLVCQRAPRGPVAPSPESPHKQPSPLPGLPALGWGTAAART